MNPLQILRCALGHHTRSVGHIRIVDGRRESICRGCGRKMIKDDFKWQIASAAAEAGPTLLPRNKTED